MQKKKNNYDIGCDNFLIILHFTMMAFYKSRNFLQHNKQQNITQF